MTRPPHAGIPVPPDYIDDIDDIRHYLPDLSMQVIKEAWVHNATPAEVIATIKNPEHITDGRDCWCNPDINYIDPITGAAVIVHKEPS